MLEELNIGGDGQASQDMLQMAPFGDNAAKDLLKTPDEVIEILMNSNIEDANAARDIAITLAQLDEFGLIEEKKIFLYLLALNNSIKAKGRDDYLQGIVGIYWREIKKRAKEEQTPSTERVPK